MTKLLKYLFPALMVGFLALSSCKDYWKEHNSDSGTTSEVTLLEKIKNEPQLTLFAKYLKITGLDTLLTRVQQYTVWAPTNKALYAMDSTIAKDTALLRKVISNHFCLDEYSYNLSKDTVKVRMYSGKLIVLVNALKQIEGANYISNNNICSNGYLHIVDKVLLPKSNIWEIIQSLDQVPTLTNYISSQSKKLYFDPLVSTIIGTDPTTGGYAYDSIKYNKFLFDVAPMQREDSTYTFFAISDNVFNSEYVKYSPYCQGSTLEETDSITKVCVVKDLAVKGRYTKNQLPDTLVSVNGVKIHIDKSAIVKTYEASNGLVHVISKLDLKLRDKLLPVIVEGEDAITYGGTITTDPVPMVNYSSQASGGAYVYWKFTANKGAYCLHYYAYDALQLTNTCHKTNNFKKLNLFSTKYRAYFRVVNKNDDNFINYSMYLSMYYTNTGTYSYVPRFSANPIFLCTGNLGYNSGAGLFRDVFAYMNSSSSSTYSFSLTNVKNLALRVIPNANTQVRAGIVFDYIKLEPQIQ